MTKRITKGSRQVLISANDETGPFTARLYVNRGLLKTIHRDVRKAFPAIRDVRNCIGATCTSRGINRQWFVQINACGHFLNLDCRAYNATEAKYKAWCAFLEKYAPQL